MSRRYRGRFWAFARGLGLALPAAVALLVLGLLAVSPAMGSHGDPWHTIEMVSVSAAGVDASAASASPDISSDGRYVVFSSGDSNLVRGDINGQSDILVYDRQTASTTLVSLSTAGVQGNFGSFDPSISSDGRFVAFVSEASNLVSGDTANKTDVFVRDRDSDADGIFDEAGAVSTVRVSVATDGIQSNGTHNSDPAVSDNGRFVAFLSSATNLVAGKTNDNTDVYVRDRDTDADGIFDEAGAVATVLVSVSSSGTQGGFSSFNPSISGDGRYVVFRSSATNLVAGDTNGFIDIFVRDRDTDADGIFDEAGAVSTVRVNVSSAGAQADFAGGNRAPAISGNGRFVFFDSLAANLVTGDTNNTTDVFVHDRDADADGVFDEPGAISTARVSVSSAGAEANGVSEGSVVSDNGRFVVFESDATNLVTGDTNTRRDIFVHDRDTDADGIFDEPGAVATIRVNVSSAGAEANESTDSPAISGDGLLVVFTSRASNLVAGDINGFDDIFVRDHQAGQTTRITVALLAGLPGDRGSNNPAITPNGRFVAFESDAVNLVVGDGNNTTDIFVRDRNAAATTRVSISSAGAQADGFSQHADISDSARHVVFESGATNLVTGDTNAAQDIFVRDRDTDADGVFDEAGAVATVRVSVSSAGVQATDASFEPTISGDGRFVAFYNCGTNLVAGDTNAACDVFVRDRDTDADGLFDESGAVATIRVSVSSAGAQGNKDSYNPVISRNGRFVAFFSSATNLVTGDTNARDDVFVLDRDTDADGIFDEPGAIATTRVSVSSAGTQATGHSCCSIAISDDGRIVAFESDATNLVTGDSNARTDVFVHDRQTAATTRTSIHTDGTQGNNNSVHPALSADGGIVAFDSDASNIVLNDNGGRKDIFVRDRQAGTTELVSVASVTGEQGFDGSFSPDITGDGRLVVFASIAPNLPVPDTTREFIGFTSTGGTVTNIFVADFAGPPGTIQFITDALGAQAGFGNASAINISVTRTGGSDGAVSASFATSDGTAIAGADYTSTTGNVNWADGDSAVKLISVTLLPDAIADEIEWFVITLSSPTGGAALGTNTTTNALIVDIPTPRVTGLAAVADNAQIALSWNARSSAMKYQIYMASIPFTISEFFASAIPDKALLFTAGTETSMTVTGLVNGRTYYFSVAEQVFNNGITEVNLGVLQVSATPSATPILQFSAGQFAVSEIAGVATITVTRTGGSSGAVSVSFATSNHTAIAGSDYTATSGTLNWADGDATTKTFTVTILNDSLVEFQERINLALSNPTGGATLGAFSTSAIIITDDDGGPAIPALSWPGMVALAGLLAGVLYWRRRPGPARR